MKLISLNIEGNKHDELALPFLKKENADVVCIQELLEDKLELYKKELGLDGFFQPTNYASVAIYQHLAKKRGGVAIFAKNITEPGSFFCAGAKEHVMISFEKYKSQSSEKENNENRAVVWANVQNDKGEKIKVITTQLPVTIEGEVTPYQLEVIDRVLNKLENFKEFVFCGDINSPRGQESFARFARKYKDNIPQEYKTSIDQNLHRVKGIQFVVDCLFTTPSYKASKVKLVDGVSDHMAVVAEITK